MDALTVARDGIYEVRRATCLDRSILRELRGTSDLERCAWYVNQARVYESDAGKLAEHTTLNVLAASYYGVAGARWIAAVASLLGAREPIQLTAYELDEILAERRNAQ